MAWLSGWLKRQAITLTGGSDGSQVDFQLLLAIAYDSDMLADFSDLRFTDADSNLIDAWLEDKTDGTSADVWVEFPSTPANGAEQTYYMYYDKSDAVDYWDIGATFLFGDDFEGTYGWTGGSQDNTRKYEGTYSQKVTSSEWADAYKDVLPVNGAYMVWVNPDDVSSDIRTQIRTSGTTANQQPWYFEASASANWQYYDGALVDSGVAVKLDDWQKLEIRYIGYSKAEYYIDDVHVGTGNTPYYATDPIRAWNVVHANTSWYDLAIVRKYAANPPTYEFGSEENVPTGLTILNFERAGMRGVMRGVMRGTI